ncbi:MAG TPA: copper resistance protein NlpE N-terminal domain-containing protein [Flavobacteriaceae bacterium]|nr:copper resistance protein NlpE N-terminal domain-containing protein [Flavobacteriaceae bacterium]
MRIKLTLSILSLVFVFACKSGESNDSREDVLVNKSTTKTLPDGHNAQNSLDWAGVYEGSSYCEDCEDMKTILRLNQDNSFVLSQTAVQNGKETVRYKADGKFTWENNGSEIIVEAGKIVIRFQVRENEVRMLDMKGNVLDAQLANFYTLTKQ